MILNVKFPPMRGHSSPEAAITAGRAKHSEFTWFDPKLAGGTTIEATSYGADWFALRLSNGKRMLITAGETIVQAALDDEALPQTEPWPERVSLPFQGFKGPAEIEWHPQDDQAAMLNKRIVFVTFHPHRLILVTPGDYCAWFRLMHDRDTGRAMLKTSMIQE